MNKIEIAILREKIKQLKPIAMYKGYIALISKIKVLGLIDELLENK